MPDVVLECLRPQSLPLVSTSSNKATGYCHKAAPCCEPIGTHFIQTTPVCFSTQTVLLTFAHFIGLLCRNARQ